MTRTSSNRLGVSTSNDDADSGLDDLAKALSGESPTIDLDSDAEKADGDETQHDDALSNLARGLN